MKTKDSRKSVLVIDDDLTHQVIVADVLEQHSLVDVLHAMDGNAARSMIQKQTDKIGLIICDLHMPSFDGIEFLLHLKDRNCEIPIMIVSGAHEQLLRSAEELARAHALNIVAALRKPIDIDKFDKLIGAQFD